MLYVMYGKLVMNNLKLFVLVERTLRIELYAMSTLVNEDGYLHV